MLTASMNARYHRMVSTWAARADRALRITAAVAASGSLASSPVWNTPVGQAVWVAFSLSATIASVALATVPLKKTEEEHAALAKRWLDHHTQWQQYDLQLTGLKTQGENKVLLAPLELLTKQAGDIEAEQTGAPIGILLRMAHQQECAARGIAAQPTPTEKARNRATADVDGVSPTSRPA